MVGTGIIILGATAFGATQVLAQNNNQPSFVQQLAQKLGIDQSKVQQAVDQIKQDHKGQMQTNFQSKLDQLVKDGKITQQQEQLILNKFQELSQNKQNWKNLTPDQRKAQMQQQRQDMQTWAQQNNIDLKSIFGGNGMMRGMGWKKGLGK